MGAKSKPAPTGTPVLWREPIDITARNLFYGSGGEQHAPPSGVYTFLKEDMDGTNPKFDVRDSDGVEWKVKLGVEAQPEVAAARLVWAVGYFTNEDYFLSEIQVQNLPRKLRRGQKYEQPGGVFRNVRLKRHLKGEKKEGNWSWKQNPFVNTHELNSLRILMALINNWDLKDENNAIYVDKHKDSNDPELIYMVSDLGSSFGTTGMSRSLARSKGNLNSYARSKFVRRETGEDINFGTPSHPTFFLIIHPHDYFRRWHLLWIGRDIPRSDAKWLGKRLERLSPAQIRDAFRAAGYSPQQVEGFAGIVERRIAELRDL